MGRLGLRPLNPHRAHQGCLRVAATEAPATGAAPPCPVAACRETVLSEPVAELVAGPPAAFLPYARSAELPAPGIGYPVRGLLRADTAAILTSDPAEAITAVAELAEAATRQVFAPDPLADPAAIFDVSVPAPDAAARDAGVDVRPVDTHVDVAAAVSVLDAVFTPGTGHHFYPPSLLRNLLAAGAPVLLAWDGEAPVGVVLSLPGWTTDGRPLLQSGPMAVLRSARGRGVSVALKLAQRTWAAERGVTEIRWTFDAMMSTNASLNLRRLGATVEAFLPGYEGPRPADSATPLPFDRLLVAWRLTDAPGAVSDIGDVEQVQAVAAGPDGMPVLDPCWGAHGAARVAVPADISALRRDAPARASAWQHTVGQVLQAAVTGGWRIGWDPRGGYLLTAPA